MNFDDLIYNKFFVRIGNSKYQGIYRDISNQTIDEANLNVTYYDKNIFIDVHP